MLSFYSSVLCTLWKLLSEPAGRLGDALSKAMDAQPRGLFGPAERGNSTKKVNTLTCLDVMDCLRAACGLNRVVCSIACIRCVLLCIRIVSLAQSLAYVGLVGVERVLVVSLGCELYLWYSFCHTHPDSTPRISLFAV